MGKYVCIIERGLLVRALTFNQVHTYIENLLVHVCGFERSATNQKLPSSFITFSEGYSKINT